MINTRIYAPVENEHIRVLDELQRVERLVPDVPVPWGRATLEFANAQGFDKESAFG